MKVLTWDTMRWLFLEIYLGIFFILEKVLRQNNNNNKKNDDNNKTRQNEKLIQKLFAIMILKWIVWNCRNVRNIQHSNTCKNKKKQKKLNRKESLSIIRPITTTTNKFSNHLIEFGKTRIEWGMHINDALQSLISIVEPKQKHTQKKKNETNEWKIKQT